MTAPVFVTGGNGFIGSHLVRTLVEGGRSVRCLVRPTSTIERIAGLSCELVKGDVGDRQSLETGMAGCQSIVHLAGLAKPALFNSPLMTEIHVNGTRNVLDAALKAGIERVVYVSSTAAVGGSPQ